VERRAARPYRRAQLDRAGLFRRSALQRGQVLTRHMLMIEGQHIALPGEREQVRQRGVVPDRGASADQRRAVGLCLSQHPEPDAEADRRLAGHPRELARPHHADHGGPRALLIIGHPR